MPVRRLPAELTHGDRKPHVDEASIVEVDEHPAVRQGHDAMGVRIVPTELRHCAGLVRRLRKTEIQLLRAGRRFFRLYLAPDRPLPVDGSVGSGLRRWR